MVDIHVTERTAFKECRLYWDFNSRRMLVPLGESYGPSWLGSGIHVALATFYKYGEDPVRVWDRWYNAQYDSTFYNWYGEELERIEKMSDLARGMLGGYVEYAEKNDNWEVVAVEEPVRIEVLPDVFLVGSLDLLVRRNGKLFIVDHKTVSTFVDSETLVFDDQMVLYLWLVWKKYNEVPGGAIYSMLRKALPYEPPTVYKGTALSKAKNIDTTYELYLSTLLKYGFDPSEYTDVLEKLKSNRFFHRETVVRSARELKIFDDQIVAEAREMTRLDIPIYPTMTRDCTWSCQFTDLCRTRLTGGDVEYTIQTGFREATRQERYHERWLEPETREHSSDV